MTPRIPSTETASTTHLWFFCARRNGYALGPTCGDARRTSRPWPSTDGSRRRTRRSAADSACSRRCSLPYPAKTCSCRSYPCHSLPLAFCPLSRFRPCAQRRSQETAAHCRISRGRIPYETHRLTPRMGRSRRAAIRSRGRRARMAATPRVAARRRARNIVGILNGAAPRVAALRQQTHRAAARVTRACRPRENRTARLLPSS